MQTIIKLNSMDIKAIIAKHYKVDEGNVIVKSEQVKLDGTAVGYRQRYVPIANVTLKD